jgi:DNA topoisomerase I
MGYTLLIVESPAKCQKIEKFLGPDYKVLGSYGHITHLSDLKHIDFANNFKPSFQIIESKTSQISKLRKAIQLAKEVILATDDDREGEAIAWHISQVFKLDPIKTKRIIFHEITEKAIKNALKNPGLINMNLVYAQQGRQILDLIVGYKITPMLWQNIVSNTKNSLSAGRCQTPALRLVYDNYKEIESSPGKLSFNSVGYFTSKVIPFSLNKNHLSHDEIKSFLEKSKIFSHSLSKEKLKQTKKNPPQPFTTSALQQSANNYMHISPKETMELAQKLYEGGYITYMRTDSKVYSEEFIKKSIEYISSNYDEAFVNPSIKDITQKLNDGENTDKTDKIDKKMDKKSKKGDKKKEDSLAQEAHEAIRPTNVEIESIPEDEDVYIARHRKLYKIIWNNTLESMMAPALYNQLNIKVTAPEDCHYKYSAEDNIFPGWKAIQGLEEDKYFQFLQNVKEAPLKAKKITSKQTLKDLKSHYTEAKLVQLLEQRGIGRPSTFSSLIDKIQQRDYVKKQNITGKKLDVIDYIMEDSEIKEESSEKEFGNEKNKLVITQTGIIVLEFLIKYFNDLFDYDYTKMMENELDIIAKGAKPYYILCDQCNKFIEELSDKNNLINRSSTSNNIEKLNIKIDSKHTYLIGKNGPTIKYTKEDGKAGFYGVKKDICMEKLKNGEYKLEDIMESKEDNNKLLGEYKGKSLYLKNGKFGYYLECGELKKTLKSVKINVPLKNIGLEDAISILENVSSNDNSLIRKIDDSLAIRSGKFGDYIFYKTEKMKKPQFLKLYSFNDDYKNCSIQNIRSWIKEKYQI